MTVRLTVSLYETHLQLLDEVVKRETHGRSREEVLRNTLLDHAKYLLSGGTPHDPAPWTNVSVKRPAYGKAKFEKILQPGEGTAMPVLRGEVLHMIQVVGNQGIDFNGYNLHDYKEWLDCGFNRQRGIVTGPGTVVWSGSPRGRPMYVILDASESMEQFYGGHRCNGIILEREYGFAFHASCQDSFAEAIREYGLTEDDVHDSYNFFAYTYVDAQGRRIWPWNPAEKGDLVDLLAVFDTLSVPVCCASELNAVNNYDPGPIKVEVMESTPETLKLVEVVEKEWGQLKMQRGPADFKIKEILNQRELVVDPDYQPEFLPMPDKQTLEMEISEQEQKVLQGLVREGHYGPTQEQALLVAFIRWYDQNRMKRRYMRLKFQP
jgi:uncharacterized protein